MQNSQEQAQITPDEAKASLGVATNLMSQLMPQQQPQQQEMPQENPQEQAQNEPQAPQEQIDPNAGLKDLETKIMDEIGGLKDMIKENAPKDKNKELEDLKKQINEVLNESDETSKT